MRTVRRTAAFVALGTLALLFPVAGDEPSASSVTGCATWSEDDTAAACGSCHKD